MRNRAWIWALAVVVTLGSAVYQRMTGPTYPIRGKVTLGGQAVGLRLNRTHAGPTDQPVSIAMPDRAVEGDVAWRRFPTSDPWTTKPLVRNGDLLETSLPVQPVSAKLEYQLRLRRGTEQAVFPELPAVTRFRNEVPDAVLIPHVFCMFVAMLFSTLAGLSALSQSPTYRRETHLTMGFLLVGGFVLGPLMQWYGFGAWWTGIPFGFDLTDNKTLFAAVAWAWAWWSLRGNRQARLPVIAAAIVTLVVFAIPHSVWGSQLNWDSIPKGRP
jgi:hypothetical protein